jgi:hypothetical protein
MSHDASFARARRAAITSQIQAETDVDEAMIALTPSTRHVRGFAVTLKRATLPDSLSCLRRRPAHCEEVGAA